MVAVVKVMVVVPVFMKYIAPPLPVVVFVVTPVNPVTDTTLFDVPCP